MSASDAWTAAGHAPDLPLLAAFADRGIGVLERTYPAAPRSVPLARREVAAFVAGAGVSGELLDSVYLATSEALTNVVLHAYPAREGAIHLTAAVVDSELWISIADDGRGIGGKEIDDIGALGSGGLGLGLSLIEQVTDGFSIADRSSGGTELRLRFAINGRTHDAH